MSVLTCSVLEITPSLIHQNFNLRSCTISAHRSEGKFMTNHTAGEGCISFGFTFEALVVCVCVCPSSAHLYCLFSCSWQIPAVKHASGKATYWEPPAPQKNKKQILHPTLFDFFLKMSTFKSKRWLVSHGRWQTSENDVRLGYIVLHSLWIIHVLIKSEHYFLQYVEGSK